MKVSPQVSVISVSTVQVASPQLSATTALGSGRLSPHSTIASSSASIVGGVLSTTVMVYISLAEFPHKSVAV